MGENWGCLQSCQKCCFKRFISVHTQATVLQSCQSKLLTLKLFKRCETKQLRTNFIDNLRVMPQKKKKKEWRMLWRKWVNFRMFWGNSNSSSSWNTQISAATTTMFNYYTIHHKKIYLGTYGDIAASSRYPGHVYIITSYKLLYDVITYPCHGKIYMQLTRNLRVLAWRWVERHFPAIFTHHGLTMSYVSEETYRKNWCRVVCQTFKLSTERGHSYY